MTTPLKPPGESRPCEECQRRLASNAALRKEMEALRGMLLGVQASFEAERASLFIRIDELERQILDQNMLIADLGRTSAEHNKLSADQAAEIKELRREIQERIRSGRESTAILP